MKSKIIDNQIGKLVLQNNADFCGVFGQELALAFAIGDDPCER